MSDVTPEPSPAATDTVSLDAPAPPAPAVSAVRLPAWVPPLFYLSLALVFLWRSSFLGEVFLPAQMLGHVAPYAAQTDAATLPAWNPLRWDGIAQFYPWRRFAAETLREGTIPLWNPYQFCGTPFVANSQSAVFYPGNLVFALFSTERGFHLNALLHLTLCGWFAYLLLRRLRLSEGAALLAGVAYAYSAWQVAWMQLPTFLAASCWFPLLLSGVLQMNRWARGDADSRRNPIPALGLATGLMLLAGHLQIAFYGLLAGTLCAFALLALRLKQRENVAALRLFGGCLGGLALGIGLATPQMLPSIELARVSHRVGRPTADGYRLYAEYALPASGLMALTLPNFFGNDYDPNNRYWGFYLKPMGDGSLVAIRHNAAETANYVGIVTLLLGLLALARNLKRGGDRRVWFFGGVALLSLLLALGTPINALFYFFVPGFGQSGSPARSLVLWALGWAALAGFGFEALRQGLPTKRELGVALGVFAALFVLGVSLAAQFISGNLLGFKELGVPVLGEVLPRLAQDWIALAVWTGCGVGLILFGRRGNPVALTYGAPLLIAADLFLVGIRLNPTAPPALVYPVTPGLKVLLEQAGHNRIFPINAEWSLYKSPPAVLPPNAAMVYRLRDVQGYDSLLTGQYKAFANGFARRNGDASPPEVGNMVFFQNANAPDANLLGAAFALTVPTGERGFAPEAVPSGAPIYNAAREMAVYPMPNAPRARLLPDGAPVEWLEDRPTRVTLRASDPNPKTLYLADQFFPGWKAFVDGREVPLLRYERTPFRAVALPAGQHTVSFRYEPTAFRLGLHLACFSLSLLVCFSVANRRIPSPSRRTERMSA